MHFWGLTYVIIQVRGVFQVFQVASLQVGWFSLEKIEMSICPEKIVSRVDMHILDDHHCLLNSDVEFFTL